MYANEPSLANFSKRPLQEKTKIGSEQEQKRSFSLDRRSRLRLQAKRCTCSVKINHNYSRYRYSRYLKVLEFDLIEQREDHQSISRLHSIPVKRMRRYLASFFFLLRYIHLWATRCKKRLIAPQWKVTQYNCFTLLEATAAFESGINDVWISKHDKEKHVFLLLYALHRQITDILFRI